MDFTWTPSYTWKVEPLPTNKLNSHRSVEDLMVYQYAGHRITDMSRADLMTALADCIDMLEEIEEKHCSIYHKLKHFMES